MNNIEQKALALVNEIAATRGTSWPCVDRANDSRWEALCRAIEQHEAFRQEVSDAVEEYYGEEYVAPWFAQFIIPKPKPDPLAQTLGDFDGTLWGPEDVLRFRAALEARGLEIREKGQ